MRDKDRSHVPTKGCCYHSFQIGIQIVLHLLPPYKHACIYPIILFVQWKFIITTSLIYSPLKLITKILINLLMNPMFLHLRIIYTYSNSICAHEGKIEYMILCRILLSWYLMCGDLIFSWKLRKSSRSCAI